MKKFLWLMTILLSCTILGACGNEDGESVGESQSEYYSVEATQKGIGTPDPNDGKWQLLSAQYYRGEAVQIWYTPNETKDGLVDVYLYRGDGSMQLLVSELPEAYRGSWFLDENGENYILSEGKITRISADGVVLYSKRLESQVLDICQMEDGSIFLLVQKEDEGVKLAALDVEAGTITEKANVQLEKTPFQYISAYEGALVLLNAEGLWEINLTDGSLKSLFDFTKVSYQLDMNLGAFRMTDGENVEFLYNDKVESLQIGTVSQEKVVAKFK